MANGEEYAWERLKELAVESVCSRTGATFDPETNSYGLDLFEQRVDVSLDSCEFAGHTPQAKHLLTRLSYFSRLSVLTYLLHGKDIPPSRRLVKPEEMPGMTAMVGGSHTLPLDGLCAKYGENVEAFLERGREYGGVTQEYGDASLLLRPFRALPVMLVLWAGDEEFGARCSLLLDTTSQFQGPADFLWCVMMLTVLAMM
ncbi:MAG: DUF3786 domain-containing protein [Lentisphaerae bacterium]|nr:DUF3786 domain-containing protein [Lentisphaerota bacterium]